MPHYLDFKGNFWEIKINKYKLHPVTVVEEVFRFFKYEDVKILCYE